MEAYETYLRIECGYSPLTIRAHLSDLRGVQTWIAANVAPPLELDRADYDTLTAYMRAATASGHASSTLARRINTLRGYLRFRGRSELAQRLEIPRQRRGIPEIPNRAEVARLMDEPKPYDATYLRDRAILELLYATGIRGGELAALTIGDLAGQAQQLRVIGKGNKERRVPVYALARQKIADYLATRPGARYDERMFLATRGGSLNEQLVYRIVCRYAKRSGQRVRVHPHTLRHAFASHLLADGRVTLNEIRVLLGHESLDTTAIYLHTDIHARRKMLLDCHPRERMARGEPAQKPLDEQRRRDLSECQAG